MSTYQIVVSVSHVDFLVENLQHMFHHPGRTVAVLDYLIHVAWHHELRGCIPLVMGIKLRLLAGQLKGPSWRQVEPWPMSARHRQRSMHLPSRRILVSLEPGIGHVSYRGAEVYPRVHETDLYQT